MQKEYFKIFNKYYNTQGNNELFKNKIPDGWDIINNNLIIIENKKNIKQQNQAKEQLKEYLKSVPKGKFKGVYLIAGYGISEKNFEYIIYNPNLQPTKLTLIDLNERLEYKQKFNVEEIHKLNQFMYNNGINLAKSQKTLFIASVLICLKINPEFSKLNEHFKNSIVELMIKTIDNYYSDKTFSGMFLFLKRSIYNKHLLHIFKTLQNDILIYGSDILNRFYSEFCLWDRNNDASFGVVLTPPDIVKMMVDELQIEETDKVLDFCTGTGSFLIECGKYTKHLFGCENNDERYSLAKCNFILNDFDYTNLKYNSCFNEQYESNYFDKVIINPPFNCTNTDEENQNDDIGWKNFKKEQKFVLYGIEMLKPSGIGCFIIPSSNFIDSKLTVKFKNIILSTCRVLKIINLNSRVFHPNASVTCSILIVQKLPVVDDIVDEEYETEIIDYTQDGYKIYKNCRIEDKDSERKMNTHYCVLDSYCNWNFIKDDEITENDLIKSIEISNVENYISQLRNAILSKTDFSEPFTPLKYEPIIDILNLPHFTYCLSDILIKCNCKSVIISKCEPGDYPLVSSTSINNGISNYISEFTYDAKDEKILSINKNGSVGYCFVQTGKFAKTADVEIFKVREDVNIHLLSAILTKKLTTMFNYTYKITWDRIKDITISL